MITDLKTNLNLKILIVDDELLNRKLLGDLLAHSGNHVTLVENGQQALEVLNKEEMDIVLLDLMMPTIDGIQVLKALTRKGLLPKLSVIVVSAITDSRTRQLAYTSGACGFLSKPIDQVELFALITKIAQTLKYTENNLSKKKILVVEDDELLRNTLRTILLEKFEVTLALNGLDAIKIMEHSSFDLIISDIQMPFYSGVDLLLWVKSRYSSSELAKYLPKFILMTGFNQQTSDMDRAKTIGADDFLSKPFTEITLMEKIEKLLNPDDLKLERL